MKHGHPALSNRQARPAGAADAGLPPRLAAGGDPGLADQRRDEGDAFAIEASLRTAAPVELAQVLADPEGAPVRQRLETGSA